MTSAVKAIFRDLSLYILLSNLVFTLGPLVSSAFVPKYLHEYLLYMDNVPFSYSISFDGIIFLTNQYQWEVNYAFLPGYTCLLRTIKWILGFAFSDTALSLVITAVVLNKILTALSSVVLVMVARRFLNKKQSLLVGILYLFNPSAIFYHSVYSEPLFTLITLLGCYQALNIHTDPVKPVAYIKSNLVGILLFSSCILIRTTGMFYSLIYGVPILVSLFHRLRQREWGNCVSVAVSGAITLFCFVAPFIVYLWAGYREFCNSLVQSKFCHNRVPNIYSYIEEQFWDVGFLKYYSKGQELQVVFGLTTVVILLLTLTPSLYVSLESKGLFASILIISTVIVVYANVQSGTRFLSTHPVFYLNIAHFISHPRGTRPSILQKAVMVYFVVYNCFGLVFFPARFSWA